jgi:hypothetical protein
MSDQHSTVSEAISNEIGAVHNALLLGGYERAEQLLNTISSLSDTQAIKQAAGQDWSAHRAGAENGALAKANSELIDLWRPSIPSLETLSAQSYFDSQGRREWAVVYLGAINEELWTVVARMGPWIDAELELYIHPLPTAAGEPRITDFPEREQERAIMKIQHAIYGSIGRMHAIHLMNGYRDQKDAYARFQEAVPNDGFFADGTDRLETSSTERTLGARIDPEATERAFRDSWKLDLDSLTVLSANYFPTADGLDRWFVCYAMRTLGVEFSVFVKYYPHRLPQIEVITGRH